MPQVTVIPATMSQYSSTPINSERKRRVAAYARVSTDMEEQQSSYAAQCDYYTRYIQSRSDWEFQAIYSDEGISGTSTKRREGFQKMVEDALSGSIDLIITKSISRFARNTVDSLTTIRLLKEHGTEVFFEKENLHTFDPKCELVLSILSSLSQEESRSISENVTWGQRKKFSDGRFSMAYSRFLGYDKGEDGTLVINEEQAKIVRRIFGLCLQGHSPYAIAKILDEDGVPTPAGGKKWRGETVRRILTNEKMKGDALLQKTYTSDYLTKKMKKNTGQVQQYYVKNSHPAIIEPEVFDMVQRQLAARSGGKSRQNTASIFSGMLICGNCGSIYGSKVWHSTDQYRRVIFQCNHKFQGEKCRTPHLTEEQIQEMFVEAANRVFQEKDELLAGFTLACSTVFDVTALEAERDSLVVEMKVVAEQVQNSIAVNARIAQDQTEYQRRYGELVDRYERAKARLEEVEASITDKTARHDAARLFLDTLKKQEQLLSEFDESLWFSMVESVTIYSEEDARFRFKDGTEISVDVPKRKRRKNVEK